MLVGSRARISPHVDVCMVLLLFARQLPRAMRFVDGGGFRLIIFACGMVRVRTAYNFCMYTNKLFIDASMQPTGAEFFEVAAFFCGGLSRAFCIGRVDYGCVHTIAAFTSAQYTC